MGNQHTDVRAQINALNREVAEIRNKEKESAVDQILALMDQHSVSIEQLRDVVQSTGGYSDADVKAIHYTLKRRSTSKIRPPTDVATGTPERPQERAANDDSKAPPRWPEMAFKQRRMFNAWQKQPDADLSRLGVWIAALAANGYDIDANASHEGFLAVSRQIKDAGDDESLRMFDLWCAAVLFGNFVDLGADILNGRAAAIAWLFKPAPSLQRALPINSLWTDPDVIGEQLERMLRLFRPV